jgi:hypothetical protein
MELLRAARQESPYFNGDKDQFTKACWQAMVDEVTPQQRHDDNADVWCSTDWPGTFSAKWRKK